MMGGAALAAAAAGAFPDEVWEHVFSFLTADGDRNAISLVCRAWQRIDRFSRRRIFVGNCYAVCPRRVVERFPALRAVSIKGKPHFADFNLVPQDWGGDAYHWIATLAAGCPLLEELRLKRMVVSDECLELVAKSFCNFKVLVLATCEGFTTAGLATIAANCRCFIDSFVTFLTRLCPPRPAPLQNPNPNLEVTGERTKGPGGYRHFLRFLSFWESTVSYTSPFPLCTFHTQQSSSPEDLLIRGSITNVGDSGLLLGTRSTVVRRNCSSGFYLCSI